ncbi:vanomycin resistance protein VanB [Sinosporangium siamense]|uniref:Vanomycin resistance protein VanB n=2 Tax=Sinosporangium siamense TaxID=1367973 RepID=A0A919REV6_9ACTN|nr:vanomycin resistance protein VanB [Sinosporangium siamense]
MPPPGPPTGPHGPNQPYGPHNPNGNPLAAPHGDVAYLSARETPPGDGGPRGPHGPAHPFTPPPGRPQGPGGAPDDQRDANRLPPGVSPDIFGSTGFGPPGGHGHGQRPGHGDGTSALPSTAPVPQPWPMAAGANEERPASPPPPQGRGPAKPPAAPKPAPRPSGDGDDGEPKSRRGLLIALLSVVALAGLAYLIPALVMSGAVLPRTTVEGVDIGGLSATEAADKLRERLSERIGESIELEAYGRKHAVVPEKAGLEFDVAGTVAQAPSGFPSPAGVWRALTAGTTVQAKVKADSAKLSEAVAAVAKKIDRPARESEIRYRGTTPVAIGSQTGRELDQQAAAELVKDAFLRPRTPIQLTVAEVKPKVSAATVKRTLATAKKAVSGPLTLTANGRQAQLPAARIAAHLTFVADGRGGMRPEFEAHEAMAGLDAKLVPAGKAPKDATFNVVGGKLKPVAGKSGEGVDAKALAGSVAGFVAKGGNRTIPVKITKVKPRMNVKDIKGLGITEKVSEFTTPYTPAPRVTNIQTIARILDGYIVRPGETFSLNTVVGERDKARGFVEAPQISGGRLVDSVGGGISQFVTTMYNAVFFGGFQDVKHTPHEFYISRYPAGRESTVSFPEPDFIWRNDSKYGVLVKTSYTSSSVTVAFWSTKRYDEIKSESSARYNFTDFKRETSDAPKCIPMVGTRGFTIEVSRVFIKDGKEVKREKNVTVYKPEVDLKCTNPER